MLLEHLTVCNEDKCNDSDLSFKVITSMKKRSSSLVLNKH